MEKIVQEEDIYPAEYRSNFPGRKRFVLWAVVVLYTVALPFVILVFRALDRSLPPPVTARLPLILILVMAVCYVALSIRRQTVPRCLVVTVVSGTIALLIMKFEHNPNKYIHIPEYVVMTWLLYQALAIDYRGGGILALVFICACMLGVVDELLQGIHPQRTYGWKDMIVDGASSFMGILTLAGVKPAMPGGWGWISGLKGLKGLLLVTVFGLLSGIATCACLFGVQGLGMLRGIYPHWLLTANVLFPLMSATAVILYLWDRRIPGKVTPRYRQRKEGRTTVLLWVICPLAIVTVVHLLALWVVLGGLEFR